MGRRLVESKTFHEAWNCSSCGQEGISAYNCKQCPSCGAPLGTHQVYRTQKLVEDYQPKEADVICAHCETRNEARFSCRNCGASLQDGDDARVQAFVYKKDEDWKQPPKPRQPFTSSQSLQLAAAETLSWRDSTTKWTPRTPLPLSQRLVGAVRSKWFLGGATVLVGLLVWFVVQTMAVIPVDLTAESAYWSYSLAREDFRPRAKSKEVEDGRSWSPPGDAYDMSQRRAHLRTEDIYESRHVSKTCSRTESESVSNGDGTWTSRTYSVDYDCSYTEQVKVGENQIWGTRYRYTVDRWEATSPLTRDGWGKEPNFPVFEPTPTLRARGRPKLHFKIYFSYQRKEEIQKVDREMSRGTWDGIRLGQAYPAAVNGFGKILAVQGIDPEYAELVGEAEATQEKKVLEKEDG